MEAGLRVKFLGCENIEIEPEVFQVLQNCQKPFEIIDCINSLCPYHINIKINVFMDVDYLPNAILQVDFKLNSTGTTQVVLGDNTALASNGWCLFEDARLRLNDIETAHLQKPGKAAHMRMLLEVNILIVGLMLYLTIIVVISSTGIVSYFHMRIVMILRVGILVSKGYKCLR